MLQLQEDRRPPITPQLAVRVAILAGIALTMFAIIFFRLWYLQVLSGEKYLAEASNNQLRDVVIPAPRGDILDRNGRVLVDNRVSIAVQLRANEVPPRGPRRTRLLRSLQRVIGVTPPKMEREIKAQRTLLPYANITLRQDVSPAVRDYVQERQNHFPGVEVNKVYLRSYPHRELAAQIFGTVGQIGPDELKLPRNRGVGQGSVVGKGGLEFTYDRYLRGQPGATRIQVDAFGRSTGQFPQRLPLQGKQLKLSLDLDLQRAGQQAMSEAGGIPITDGTKNRGGAFVAMDPRTGEVVGMGSFPSFDPNLFAKPLKQSTFNKLNSEESGAPLINRATSGAYPTGSTFKLITALAAMESGTITPDTVIDDPGSIRIGNITFHNALNTAHGAIAMRRAIAVSSDVFFYRLGAQMNGIGGNILQTWASRLGMGRPTGIDLPEERTGLIPSPAWRNKLLSQKLTDRPWSVGDNVNLAVGQGDLQATPLQLAVAYSTLVQGGNVPTPHLGLRIEDGAGRLLQKVEPPPVRHVKIDPTYRQVIMDGLQQAAGSPGGTSADVFAGFGRTVLGKTGTAERANQLDQSWYVAYAPDQRRPLVVAVTVEQGGFGAETAAPAARLILSEWFGVKKRLVRGASATR
ncbi:MAG: penicillin-binding protein 2 [Solirubrobacteraceae bacterium]|jgi:penicillin-binding protein 2|nr:penicillin-binding protein 2 [Solirubrobacteraceae bacterium]